MHHWIMFEFKRALSTKARYSLHFSPQSFSRYVNVTIPNIKTVWQEFFQIENFSLITEPYAGDVFIVFIAAAHTQFAHIHYLQFFEKG